MVGSNAANAIFQTFENEAMKRRANRQQRHATYALNSLLGVTPPPPEHTYPHTHTYFWCIHI